MCLFDGFIVVFALAQIFGIFDLSGGVTQIWWSHYTHDPPTFPWVVGVLGALSVAAAFLAMNGWRFAIVFGVALAWVALGVVAIATGSGEGLLAQRTFYAALLFTSRSWFDT
jgi:hypothetical protein